MVQWSSPFFFRSPRSSGLPLPGSHVPGALAVLVLAILVLAPTSVLLTDAPRGLWGPLQEVGAL